MSVGGIIAALASGQGSSSFGLSASTLLTGDHMISEERVDTDLMFIEAYEHPSHAKATGHLWLLILEFWKCFSWRSSQIGYTVNMFDMSWTQFRNFNISYKASYVNEFNDMWWYMHADKLYCICRGTYMFRQISCYHQVCDNINVKFVNK